MVSTKSAAIPSNHINSASHAKCDHIISMTLPLSGFFLLQSRVRGKKTKFTFFYPSKPAKLFSSSLQIIWVLFITPQFPPKTPCAYQMKNSFGKKRDKNKKQDQPEKNNPICFFLFFFYSLFSSLRCCLLLPPPGIYNHPSHSDPFLFAFFGGAHLIAL